jgi:hypothetical protein
MKRYWLFEQQQYYPNGGMLDFKGDFDTLEDAENAKTPETSSIWDEQLGFHIIDIHERMIISGWDQFSKVVIKKQSLDEFIKYN